MATGKIYQGLTELKSQGKSGFAVLVDPEKVAPADMQYLAELCNDAGVDYLLMGGSLIVEHQLEASVKRFKEDSDIPVLLFPGSPAQVTPYADGLLYLSLISGRNPELLIGQHVVSAPAVRASGLEIISTGYMVVDGGRPTTVSYMSHSAPIPSDKPDIALCTAWAGELQGKHVIYMDAGSGAKNPISEEMIKKVGSNIEIPLFIGGGIKTPEKVYDNCKAGANIVVVGNAIERDPLLIKELVQATKEARSSVK
ncbi:MAG: geranylgeranylglyceryl/heptaprenylglyceryl phosphate synthase [Chitinophagales bacterium]|nr:geranylgeranylglyceryl/heptaprenylglyceryl phosphate synthase [Chitinophagaceae bacterium]MCB9065482.1 geranylgeranylglyceryl/heptaprenylglyceryl phosphate synthase [Chitinophagales bacterium]